MGEKTVSWPMNLIQLILAALISGTVVAAIVAAILDSYFSKNLEEFRSVRERDEAVLTQLIGPATMHFARTKAIVRRYGDSPQQLFEEADLLRESNEEMRELLITKGYLIPTKLIKRPNVSWFTTIFG